jgi:3-deoxy-D-manno-octulosonic acid kinase
MLYDSSRASNLTVSWFSPRYWESLGAVEGHAREGRGLTRFIKTQDLNFVLRHYHRGGAMARVSSTRYTWRGEDRTRPFREWQLTYRMHRAGLPVAAPIAALYQRRLGTYTGDILIERLPVKGALSDCLRDAPVSLLTWISSGRCIRRFHDFGVCHADLNARNVLVGEELVYLIDFDRCRLRRPGLWRDSNLVRLRRSLEKVTYALPRERFTEADWHALLDGYRQQAKATASPPEAAAGPLPGSIS